MRELTQGEIEFGQTLMVQAMVKAEKAMNKFPQPNYVLTKVAEEAGEVVKAGVHLSEGRDFTSEDLQSECLDTIAMCFRLLIEGDQVLGIDPVYNWELNSK